MSFDSMPEEKSFKVIHVLQYGRPQCLFTNLMPKDWPTDHGWVYMQTALQTPDVVTCKECRKLVKKDWQL